MCHRRSQNLTASWTWMNVSATHSDFDSVYKYKSRMNPFKYTEPKYLNKPVSIWHPQFFLTTIHPLRPFLMELQWNANGLSDHTTCLFNFMLSICVSILVFGIFGYLLYTYPIFLHSLCTFTVLLSTLRLRVKKNCEKHCDGACAPCCP